MDKASWSKVVHLRKVSGKCKYLIHEGDDNVDINAETIDGKNTFHSMARVIFQNQQINDQAPDSVHIPFSSDNSLKLTEAKCIKMTQLFSFEKPI